MKQEVGMVCGCPRTRGVASRRLGNRECLRLVGCCQVTERLDATGGWARINICVCPFVSNHKCMDGNQRRRGALITHKCACKHVNTPHRCFTLPHMTSVSLWIYLDRQVRSVCSLWKFLVKLYVRGMPPKTFLISSHLFLNEEIICAFYF